jgi:hypothetical protein
MNYHKGMLGLLKEAVFKAEKEGFLSASTSAWRPKIRVYMKRQAYADCLLNIEGQVTSSIAEVLNNRTIESYPIILIEDSDLHAPFEVYLKNKELPND